MDLVPRNDGPCCAAALLCALLREVPRTSGPEVALAQRRSLRPGTDANGDCLRPGLLPTACAAPRAGSLYSGLEACALQLYAPPSGWRAPKLQPPWEDQPRSSATMSADGAMFSFVRLGRRRGS